MVDPTLQGLKQLRNGKKLEPRPQKQIKGPRTLDQSYIVQERARVAATEALEAEKAIDAKGLAEVRKATHRSAQGRDRGNIARSRTARRSKYDAEGADLHRLESAMSFMAVCGMYSFISNDRLEPIN